jgi:mono/diheme cytochrome c family protein
MRDQPRYEALEASDFFADGKSARPLVEGVVARGQLREDEAFYTGREKGELVSEIPAAVTVDRQLLERGAERFRVYCSVCHSLTGDGNGMVVQRGFRRPPAYTIERLRKAPIGHFYDVMTHGFGAMPSFKTQIAVPDRWAIAAYVRVLQLSQHATIDDVPEEDQAKLEGASP